MKIEQLKEICDKFCENGHGSHRVVLAGLPSKDLLVEFVKSWPFRESGKPLLTIRTSSADEIGL